MLHAVLLPDPHLSSPSPGLGPAPCGFPESAAGCLPATAWALRSACWWAAGTGPGTEASRRTESGPETLYPPGEAWRSERRDNALIWQRKEGNNVGFVFGFTNWEQSDSRLTFYKQSGEITDYSPTSNPNTGVSKDWPLFFVFWIFNRFHTNLVYCWSGTTTKIAIKKSQ